MGSYLVEFFFCSLSPHRDCSGHMISMPLFVTQIRALSKALHLSTPKWVYFYPPATIPSPNTNLSRGRAALTGGGKKWKRNYCSARRASCVDSRLSEDLIPRKACLFKEIETEPAVILTRAPGKHRLKNNERGCGRGTSEPLCSQSVAGQMRRATETLSLARLICTESLLKSQLTPILN